MLDQGHQRSECVVMDVISLCQHAGEEGGGTAADGPDAIHAFATNFLRGLAFMLGIVPPVGRRSAAADKPFVTSNNFEVDVECDGTRVDSSDDTFTDELVGHRVEIVTNLHMAVGTDLMFAPCRDRIGFRQRAAALVGNDVVGTFFRSRSWAERSSRASKRRPLPEVHPGAQSPGRASLS